jgi:hypothetical protein
MYKCAFCKEKKFDLLDIGDVEGKICIDCLSSKKKSNFDLPYLVQIYFETKNEDFSLENHYDPFVGKYIGEEVNLENPRNVVFSFLESEELAINLSKGLKESVISDFVKSIEFYLVPKILSDSSVLDELYSMSRQDLARGSFNSIHRINTFPFEYTSNNHQKRVSGMIAMDTINSNQYKQISSLNQAEAVLEKRNPILSKFSLLYSSKNRLKSYIKQNNKDMLSKRSRTMLGSKKSIRKGHEVEDRFREICEKVGLSYLKTQQGYKSNYIANPELRLNFPNMYSEIVDKFGTNRRQYRHENAKVNDFISGIPDFLVWGEGDCKWRASEDPFFVEVKAQNSKLTERQKDSFPKISSLGYEVIIFQEKNNSHEFLNLDDYLG